jgi:hypothetical protein
VVELGARDRAQMVVLAYESGLRSGCGLTDSVVLPARYHEGRPQADDTRLHGRPT